MDGDSLFDNVELERKDKKDESKRGYNFVGSLNNWTSIEEQKIRVKTIENTTK